MTTSEIAAADRHTPLLSPVAPRAVYVQLPFIRERPEKVLFAATFGGLPASAAPGLVHVPLEPLTGSGLAELWYANGDVITGSTGAVHYSADDHFLAGVIEIDEPEHGGIIAATAFAYRAIANFQASSRFPHLLRMWNHLDAINLGDGDAERYRGFCSGRVAGLEGFPLTQFPAATVIGRRDGQRLLQVYWLAGRMPGIALENPRQLPAYRYPRHYGQTSPTFSRAMLVAPDLLLISGTASIVGHASRHPGSVAGQVDEIFNNLDSLMSHAHARAPALPAGWGRSSLIKAYVRNRADLPEVEGRLRALVPATVPFLVLLGDVCRADLLVEFDCLHAAG
jgi:chorismate lyase/3-hydroxybenzoate synthase